MSSDRKVVAKARLQYWVAGEPIPQGSKRVWKGPQGQLHMREDAGVRHTTWRYELAAQARLAMSEAGLVTPFRQPIYVALHFAIHRPQSHYGTGRNSEALVPRAPLYPTKPPDIDKLVRAVYDSMTSIVWVDDAQVVRDAHTKGFVHRWEEEGVNVSVATYEVEAEPSHPTIP